MDIGQTIKRLRSERSLTQQDVANGLFDRSYISQIEKGKVIPPLSTLDLIAKRLGVSRDVLLPNDDYDKKYKEAESLFNKAKRTENGDLTRKSWEAFRGLKSVGKMAETVVLWASIAPKSEGLIDALTTTMALHKNHPPKQAYWDVLIHFGNTLFTQQHFERACWIYQELLNDYPPAELAIRTFANLGSSFLELLEYEQSLGAFESSLELWEPKFGTRIMARCHHGLGVCYRALMNWNKAYYHTAEASKLYEAIDTEKFYEAQHNIGVLWLDHRKFNIATEYLSSSLKHYESINDNINIARSCEEFARMAFYQDDLNLANKHCSSGLRALNGSNRFVAGRLFLWKTLVYQKQGHEANAQESFSAAQALLQSHLVSVTAQLTLLVDLSPLHSFLSRVQ